MSTQSIIVYRNPVEQAMWEGAMSGSFFPIIIGIVVFFVLLLFIDSFVVNKMTRGMSLSRNKASFANLFFSAVVSISVMVYMYAQI